MADKTKHTPGPWRASAYDGGWDCVRDSDGQIIAKLGLNNPANASVLAAAPDMLAALDDIKAVASSCQNEALVGSVASNYLRAIETFAESAIAKAGGEAKRVADDEWGNEGKTPA